MPFVQGNCPNCGGTLAVDNTKDAWVCQYCNTPFIVEKAINNYNINNNIKAETVNIFGGVEKDFDIVGGVLKQYKGEATEVVIPENVSTIAYSAFNQTNIQSIKLHNKVKEVYLSSCKFLSSIELPPSVINLGLMNCTGIKSITLHEGLKFVYFEGCSSITSLILPNSITSIKKGTFRNCSSLKNLTLPDSIKEIKDDFFGCNKLNELILPSNIQYINIVNLISLTRIVIPPNVRLFSLKNCPNLKTILVSNPKTKISGTTGKETFIYNRIAMSSAFLTTKPLFAKNSLNMSKGTIELCLAKCNLCTDCGGKFNLLNTCKECGQKKKYTINGDIMTFKE